MPSLRLPIIALGAALALSSAPGMAEPISGRIPIPDAVPAQDDGPIDVTVKPGDPERCRSPENDNEIVVCGPDHGKDLRVPAGAAAPVRDPLPGPPGFSAVPPCLAMCVTISFGRPPPPVYMIDLKAIPESPKGSDAEKVGKGELSDR